MAGFETLRLDREGPIVHLILNRPAQLNAINRQMLEDLSSACESIEGDLSIKVVTLAAEGRAFCAGADLRTVQELSPDPQKWEAFTRLWHRAFNRIEALPVPVIADEEARLGDQHANFGLVAGGGGSQRLPRLIGLRRAK